MCGWAKFSHVVTVHTNDKVRDSKSNSYIWAVRMPMDYRYWRGPSQRFPTCLSQHQIDGCKTSAQFRVISIYRGVILRSGELFQPFDSPLYLFGRQDSR